MYIISQPKIQVASKYERRVDTRSYDDKKKLFEGVSMHVTSTLILQYQLYNNCNISVNISRPLSL